MNLEQFYRKEYDEGLDETPEEWDNIIQEYESYVLNNSED